MQSLLRHYRQSLALTQMQLATASGVAQNTISRLEKTHSRPDLATALRLARTLGRSVEDLFGHLVPRAPRRRVRATTDGATTEAAE